MYARSIKAVLVVAVAGLFAVLPHAVQAHEDREVGSYETTVGWLEEPAFAGFRNAVHFRVERSGGQPVANARLRVEVIFGERDGTERMGPLDLRPAFGSPGEYRAFLIPTRPGTYTFHVTGRIGSLEVNEFYTSGEETFNDVQESSAAEFPAKDPSRGDLAQRLERIDPRIDAAQAAAVSRADTARTIALVLGGLALVVAIVALVVAVRKPGRA